MNKKNSLKSTIAVSLTNYLDAGAIVAGAAGLTLWKDYLQLTEGHLGWLNAISANCLGAAIGAIIGGVLADKYGRKVIYTYNMLVYMTGVLLILLSTNFPMLLTGFLITGVSVGVGVPASWTYISESSEIGNRGRNIGISHGMGCRSYFYPAVWNPFGATHSRCRNRRNLLLYGRRTGCHVWCNG